MNIIKASVLYRLLIVISVLWIICSMIRIEPWYNNNLGDFLSFGILPIIIFWGIVWVIKGVINNHHLKRKDIDLIKGFDRIAMVIAIIAIIPTFLIGMDITKDKFRTLLPEYKAWEIKLENRKKWVIENPKLEHNDFKSERNNWLTQFDSQVAGFNIGDKQYQTIKEMEPRNKYKYPSNFECIIGSIVFALISFAIMLFGIRGITRTIRWFCHGFLKGLNKK